MRRSTVVIKGAVTSVVIAALTFTAASPPSQADTGQAALDFLSATDAATLTAVAGGVDVIEQITYSRATDLSNELYPLVHATVPAGGKVRVHVTVDPDQTNYMSVRRMPGSRLLGAAGQEMLSGSRWATVSMLTTSAARRARAAGATDATAITGITNARVIEDPWVATEPAEIARRMVLPPYTGAQDEGWTTVVTTPQADGTTLISGTINAGVPASDGEDMCVRPFVEIVVGPDGVARSSHWRETCPGKGTREYRTTSTFGPQPIQPPTTPTMPASRALR